MVKYNDDDRNKLANIAEDLFDMQHKFSSESICYMLLQHARDCIFAIDEISLL